MFDYFAELEDLCISVEAAGPQEAPRGRVCVG